jgi:hypothetical protein
MFKLNCQQQYIYKQICFHSKRSHDISKMNDNINMDKLCLFSEQDKYKKSLKIPKVIKIRKSKKNRQHNGQKKKDKGTNNYLQNIHIKLKIELHESR